MQKCTTLVSLARLEVHLGSTFGILCVFIEMADGAYPEYTHALHVAQLFYRKLPAHVPVCVMHFFRDRLWRLLSCCLVAQCSGFCGLASLRKH